MHLPQINVMMLFSSSRTMPSFIRILPGSISDVSAMAKTIDMAGVEKCVIVADKDLRDDHMMFTYMFLNLLSLYLHFQILNMIDGKYSVRDVLLILSRIKIYSMERSEIMSEVTKKAKDLVSDLKIDLDILRKKA